MTASPRPEPLVDATTRPFFEAAAQGELRLQCCAQCAAFRFPPTRLCHLCGSGDSEWQQTSGKGVVWSFCVFHRAYFEAFESAVPYAVVLVELDEGVRVYANLLGVPTSDIRIGMRVSAQFVPVREGVSLVQFRPDQAI